MEEDKDASESKTVIFNEVDLYLGIPRSLGQFDVLEKLGEGGMAAVYKAVDKGLGVPRALKVPIPQRASDPVFLNKFRREARLSANLQHPNIATIYTVGEDKGYHYLAMDLIEGIDLKKLIQKKRQPIPVPIALSIIGEVCSALAYAHGHHFLFDGQNVDGVIHRDIKPENIMVTHEGTVKLMDFGIAKPMGVTSETVVGTIIGTFAYMSPEQLMGRSNEIDKRTDIFSLGAVLYEITTGQRAFPGDDWTTVIENIKNVRYTPPRRLNPKVTGETETIIGKALQKERDRRYQTAGEMLEDIRKGMKVYPLAAPHKEIQRYVADGISPPPPPPPPPPPSPFGRMKKLVAAAAAAVVIIVVGVYIGINSGGSPPPPTNAKVKIYFNQPPVKVRWNGQSLQIKGDMVEVLNVPIGIHKVEAWLTPTGEPVEKTVEVRKTGEVYANVEFPTK